MRQSVLRTRARRWLRTGATGALLGVPLTLSAAGTIPGAAPSNGAAPVVVPAASSAPVTPVASPSQPQFQSERYETEVQRQLQLLYQQSPQSGSSANAPGGGAQGRPGTPVKPRKMRLKEYFSPSAWKRQYQRQQRYSEAVRQQREQQSETAMPATSLGTAVDLTPARPSGQAPSVTIPPSAAPTWQRSQAASPAPTTPPSIPAPFPAATSAAQFAAPTPVPAEVAARPQLERVSPELFGIPADDEGAAAGDEGSRFELLLPDAQALAEQPGLLPAPTTAESSPIDAQETQTPTLVLVPNPDPATETVGVAELPPAPKTANDAFGTPVRQPDQGGFLDESPETSPFTFSADTAQAATEFQPPANDGAAGIAISDETSGPFTGLELEENPFVDPPAPTASLPALEDTPVPLPAPVIEAPLATAAPERTVDDQPRPMPPLPIANVASQPASTPELPLASTAAQMSAPAALASSDAVRPVPASAEPTNRTVRPDVQEKLARIATRQGLTGFKGFCPVMLTDYRELVDAKLEYTVEHEGRRYWFCSAEAREKFMLDPTAYVPARGGIDVVIFDESGELREGSLDHALWYRGQLYLFDSAQTRAAFSAAPQKHQVR